MKLVMGLNVFIYRGVWGVPWDHGHSETNECTYAETCDGTDGDLHECGESETDAGVYGDHVPH